MTHNHDHTPRSGQPAHDRVKARRKSTPTTHTPETETHMIGLADGIQRAGVEDQLTERDVRAMVRLLGTVAGMRGELQDKRRALMDGLCELVDADTWMWTVSTGFKPGDQLMTLGFTTGGLDESQVNAIVEYNCQSEHPPLENQPLIEALGPWQHITRSRTDLIPDDRYYTSPQFDRFVKRIGIDHYLFSLYPLEGGVVSGIGVHRRTGRPDFTARERRITHIIISEVDWLHRAELPEGVGVHAPKLSPRRREVFAHLLRGWPRKRIAETLRLTDNTIAGYQKDIYKHFGVNSQPELLVRFLQGEPTPDDSDAT